RQIGNQAETDLREILLAQLDGVEDKIVDLKRKIKPKRKSLGAAARGFTKELETYSILNGRIEELVKDLASPDANLSMNAARQLRNILSEESSSDVDETYVKRIVYVVAAKLVRTDIGKSEVSVYIRLLETLASEYRLTGDSQRTLINVIAAKESGPYVQLRLLNIFTFMNSLDLAASRELQDALHMLIGDLKNHHYVMVALRLLKRFFVIRMRSKILGKRSKNMLYATLFRELVDLLDHLSPHHRL
ncbi:MAG: hypothetical protein HQL28_05540, partial [Candidatus Omnitrophica bacterium]|nr:hypothetical protein [Candidatus Omnitrophota bacterium]